MTRRMSPYHLYRYYRSPVRGLSFIALDRRPSLREWSRRIRKVLTYPYRRFTPREAPW